MSRWDEAAYGPLDDYFPDVVAAEKAAAEARKPQEIPFDNVPPVRGIEDYFDTSQQTNTPPIARPTPFKAVWLDDVVLDDEPPWLIDGLLPAGPSLSVIFGPPKSLKSFGLKHAFLHIAMDSPYCGRAVQQGAVVYITSEGVTGVKRRLIAMRRQLGIEGKQIPFALIPVMPDLGAGAADLHKLVAEITREIAPIGCPLRAIAIDTLRRAIPGKSENEQKDVGILIANCDALARHFNCHVALVHHSPRSDNTRSSGTNTLDAAADCMWSILREDPNQARAIVTIAAMKDGEEGTTWAFELRPLEIGHDRNGNPITAGSVEITSTPQHRTAAPAPTGKRPTAQEQRLLDIITNALVDVGAIITGTTSIPPNTRAISREMLKNYCTAAGWWKSDKADARRSDFSRALNSLAGKRVIGLTEEHVWRA